MTWTQTADGYTHLISLELDSDLQVNGNATITGTLTTTGAISDGADLVLANGKALKTDSTTAHTALIQAYDVDGTAYKTFVTLTNGNTPSMAIAAPSGGTVAIDGATIGATTAAAASVTALTATSTSNQLVLGTTRTLTLTAPTPASSSRTVTLPDPGGSDSVTYNALASTLTNKTITGAIYTDIVRCSAQLDRTDTTLTNITGLSTTVVPGTYRFVCLLPGTADATGGIKFAFKYTTTVVTSIEATGQGFTAAAAATQHTTTTTDQALLFDQAAAVIYTRIEGSMVVGTGGTIQLQMGEHAATSTASVYVGATMQFTRIA